MRHLLATMTLASFVAFAGAANAIEARGEVQGIDHDKRTVTVNTATFRVADEVSLQGLVPGDEVVVSYGTVDGTKIITAIRERSIPQK